jgi:hypothetical protein
MVKRQELKAIKKHRLSIKQEPVEIKKTMYKSEYCLTDNDLVAIFGTDLIEEYLSDKKIDTFETFLLTEETFDIKINRNKLLEPIEKGKFIVFENIGKVDKEIIDWFIERFPKCVFYPIQEWFGKKANTLICILGSLHGKPVGVVKKH